MSTTALTKIESTLPTRPVEKVEELRKMLGELSQTVNLIAPVSRIDTIPALHGISLRAVLIDGRPEGNEVYVDGRFCKNGEVALGGTALQKIAGAAGVQIIGVRRLDDHSEPFYCDMEVTIGLRDFDGTHRQIVKSKEIDLRDGQPEALKPEKRGDQKTGNMVALDASALADKRRHIQSLAETKAFYRALRTILSLKQKYTREELNRPFVVPKLVPALDPSDPDQKKALISMALGTERVLYGALPPGNTQQVRDVTPATAEPGHPVPPIDAKRPPAPDPDDEDAEDEIGDPVEIADTPRYICGCPCGCQKELTKARYDGTIEKISVARCVPCYPNQGFDFAAHKDLRDLGLVGKLKGKTADDLKAALDKAKK